MATDLLAKNGILNDSEATQTLLQNVTSAFQFKTLSKKLKGVIRPLGDHVWPKQARGSSSLPPAPHEPSSAQLHNARELVNHNYQGTKEQLEPIALLIASHSSGECKRLTSAMKNLVESKFPGLPRKKRVPKKTIVHDSHGDVIPPRTWSHMRRNAYELLEINYPKLDEQERVKMAEYLARHVESRRNRFSKMTKEVREILDNYKRHQNLQQSLAVGSDKVESNMASMQLDQNYQYFRTNPTLLTKSRLDAFRKQVESAGYKEDKQYQHRLKELEAMLAR
jgi:hypothetical protein